MLTATDRLQLSGFVYTNIALILLGVLCTTSLSAQSAMQDSAAGLRARLSDVQAKQAGLEDRLTQLDEQLKPENIEFALAGVGTTHPEVLREQRRRQLETEKTNVRSQLDRLNASRTRLETAIAQAEAASYQLNAGATPAPTQAQESSTPAATPALHSPVPSSRSGQRRRFGTRRRLRTKAISPVKAVNTN
jgi:DNA repair exonuclease SbcCD ATPase subunit